MKEFFFGFYGLYIYLPLSGLLRKWRRFSRKIRKKEGQLLQQISLPSISWYQCTITRVARIWEHDKANGNIRISELSIINSIAANCEDGTSLFEIGTFDGRTTLNLAFSSPTNCKVFTLDLKPEMDTVFSLEKGERHMVEKEKSGARIEKHKESSSSITEKIDQLFGDSAKFDFSTYYNSCSLVFVDGSHQYDYALSDSKEAIKMIKKGGVIIWHDYGIWEGVTKALEEIESKDKIGLKVISGTSLAYWKSE
ncbi:MAG: class I SAM-dependent methyltransferase [Methylococcales bacterium]|jgi:predicted O-methyltransferase YrrM|nr:class I SAM-dependent methyltransferase [Methylococcales bacterium]